MDGLKKWMKFLFGFLKELDVITTISNSMLNIVLTISNSES